MEWRRRHEAERREKERPENAGFVIRLDAPERKLFRDNVAIDEWKQQGFYKIRPQHTERIKIMSWNVNGVRTKLESDVQSTMLECDIISLNEVKTSLSVSFPGYVTYKSDVKVSAERGGTALLVKDYISKYVTSVDTSVEDQGWVQFCFAPKCLFGFCYIPPPDSEYFSHDSFASIQEKINW